MAAGATVYTAKRVSTITQAQYACVIGDVKSSVLTQAQFNSVMGAASSSWLLCDGQSCAGTAYATVTGESVVPDMRGQFMRGLDTTGTVDPDGATRSLGDSQAGEVESHTHTYDDVGSANSTGAAVAGYSAGPYQFKLQVGDVSGATGGDETRPTNVCVNYFIKVDW